MITNRFNSILSTIGEEVLVNDVPVNVVITNPPINDVEQRYFHSSKQIKQGDIVAYQGQKYLSLTESNVKRHDKYRVLAEWCNNAYKIQGAPTKVLRLDPVTGKIVLDKYGLPIYDTIPGVITDVPCIVKNIDLSISGKQLVVPNDQIQILLPKSPLALDRIAYNDKFLMVNKNWQITSIDYIDKGIIKLIAVQIALPSNPVV